MVDREDQMKRVENRRRKREGAEEEIMTKVRCVCACRGKVARKNTMSLRRVVCFCGKHHDRTGAILVAWREYPLRGGQGFNVGEVQITLPDLPLAMPCSTLCVLTCMRTRS